MNSNENTMSFGSKIVFSARNLVAGYDGRPVVSGVDIELRAGEIICIIGPNGAGKSTLLRTVTGHIPRLEGSMELCENSYDSISEKERARHIAVVLTDWSNPELMTCRDLVSMGRYPYTGILGVLRSNDRKKVDEALNTVDAAEIAEKQIDEVSDGQRQRIMLARAICQETEMLVLDEPTSYLDIRYRLEIMTLLRRLARSSGTAILMSVHELELARVVADHIICIRDGSVFAAGRPEMIFSGNLIGELFNLEPEKYDECFKSVIDNITSMQISSAIGGGSSSEFQWGS